MSDDSFHDVRFPEAISYGSRGGPKFNTTVHTAASGFEKRNRNWSQVRCEYDVRHGIKDTDQMEELTNFFMARWGKAFGFRYKDWQDYEATNQLIALGDGSTTTFQLVKRYTSGPSTFVRRISKPVVGSIGSFYVAGTDPISNAPYNRTLQEGADYTLDYATGKIIFAIDTGVDFSTQDPPSNGPRYRPLQHTVGLYVTQFEFDVPVRFDTDFMDVEQDSWQIQNWDKIPLVEVRIK